MKPDILLQKEQCGSLIDRSYLRGIHSIWMTEGHARLQMFDATLRLGAGDLALLPDSLPCHVELTEGRALHCFASYELFKKINQIPMVKTDFEYWMSRAGFQHQNLTHTTREETARAAALVREFSSAPISTGLAIFIEYLTLQSVIFQQGALYDLSHVQSALILQVLDYIEKNLQEKMTATEIAAAHYVSVSHLQRDFKANVEQPLNSYLQFRRLEEARRWMIYHYDAACAWHRSGFSEYTHFCKAFKQAFGLSPRDFCKQEQQKTGELL